MSTKLHLGVGETGIVSCDISSGQKQDCKEIETLWKSWQWKSIKAIIGEKSYASSAIRTAIHSHGAQAVIPRQ